MTGNIVGRPVVAGVDGSDTALNAARWAADEAARRRMPLRLVHAVNPSALAYTTELSAPRTFAEYVEALKSDGRQRLAEAETAVRQAHPELDIELDLPNADPGTALLNLSGHALLIALGSRGLGGFSRLLTGSTAVSLAAHGRCPVAVIRGRTPGEPPPGEGPVVVGVDGSPTAESALAMAFDEASLRGVALVAVHTWIEFASDREYAYARQFIVNWDAIETGEHEMLAERLAGWQEKYPDVAVRRVVTRERAVRCLLEHAAAAQLLVVGSRGRGGFAGMLLGSTSQALIHHAPCPLLVVRPTGTQ